MENNTVEVNNKCDTYLEFYDKKKTDDKLTKMRKENSACITDHYYDLATDFYEYGWGDSFHFAPIYRGDTKEQSFTRHEYQLALRLGMKPGERVVDFGCGIGGPARNIAAFTDSKLTGININDYQIQRATDLTKRAGLDHLVSYHKSDFCNISLPDGSFDKAFSIEATCHCNDKNSVYGEAYRLLKPGGMFAVYEWLMTDKYDAKNPYHKKIKEDIMEGDALPDIETPEIALSAMKKAGFEVMEHGDLAPKGDIPWYTLLMPKWTLTDFKITPMGRWATHLMLFGMEVVGFAPKGAVKVHRMLCKGADGLVKGGKEGIFTPMYFIMCRKPLK